MQANQNYLKKNICDHRNIGYMETALKIYEVVNLLKTELLRDRQEQLFNKKGEKNGSQISKIFFFTNKSKNTIRKTILQGSKKNDNVERIQ